MTLVQIGDRVLNLDQITSVGRQVRAGSTGRLSVRVHFADGRQLDFHDDGADALMGVVQARLAAPAVVLESPGH